MLHCNKFQPRGDITITDQEAREKVNAERQREYRARHREKSGRCLDIQVSLDCASNLELLSKVYNKTKKEIVEELLAKEFKKLANDPNFNVND